MTSTSGIVSFGAYIPRRRLSRAAIAEAHAWALPSLKGLGKGEKSFCNWDEDVITMAVEAGRDCLRGQTATVSALDLASTTAPYADLQNSVLVGAALDLGRSYASADFGGSTRAGLSALIKGCASGDQRLVIASEKRGAKPGSTQEMTYGSGAGALLLGSGENVIARFLGAEAVSAPFVDHFRQTDQKTDYYWEERWIRDEGIAKFVPAATKALLKRLGKSGENVAFFGLAGGPIGAAKLLTKPLGIAPERVLPDLQGQVGDTGAAQSVLLLISALEQAKPGDLIVIASFAQGCEVVAFEMQQSAPATGRRGLAGSIAQRIPETAYLKMLSFEGNIELEWGMRAEVDGKTAQTTLYRNADQIYSFVGGKCESCGQIQFPRMPACVNCGAFDSQKPQRLAEESAKVVTYTADWLQFSLSPPLYMGLVQFDIGARVLMEIVDVGPGGIDVGTPLAMTFRIKERDTQRHSDRYFWKAVPVA